MRALLILAALFAPAAAAAQINNPPTTVDTSVLVTKAELPKAATSAPPSVADASATGTMTTQYALANHTHASKQITVASLLGLTILSVPTQVATYAHYICVEP